MGKVTGLHKHQSGLVKSILDLVDPADGTPLRADRKFTFYKDMTAGVNTGTFIEIQAHTGPADIDGYPLGEISAPFLIACIGNGLKKRETIFSALRLMLFYHRHPPV
jgi:hypothetical protein